MARGFWHDPPGKEPKAGNIWVTGRFTGSYWGWLRIVTRLSYKYLAYPDVITTHLHSQNVQDTHLLEFQVHWNGDTSIHQPYHDEFNPPAYLTPLPYTVQKHQRLPALPWEIQSSKHTATLPEWVFPTRNAAARTHHIFMATYRSMKDHNIQNHWLGYNE